MSLHIYRSPGQSLTKSHRCSWITRGYKTPAFKPNALIWARCCDKRRPAKNLYAQHYYDGSYIWCLPGKGCKSDAEKRRKAKMKSIASRAGWRTRRRASAVSPAERGSQ